jgi:hypothetical protein
LKESIAAISISSDTRGVRMLKPRERLWEVFPDAPEKKHLSIVVERAYY